MDRCDCCRRKVNIMSFTCKFCHKKYCPFHQLPENHKCDIKNSDAYEKYCSTVKEDKTDYRVNRYWSDAGGHVGA